ncbi:M23 family metallopeptidase [Arthrobacter agilis]|uniref:M23 family metallopeptidase n=1 Tax=Arthrobacter agilis TaxID=37921 RepID=UPI000B3600D3|nr:M23 family metallopeptidase [Arthrobacter agilis]OUM40404.1 hypothetical protein B8W74_12810 [Arthrobacter agilis]PPB45019.1 M23 family peptidase [Arthrobacter agilis]TPV27722.1 M23 family metallopeptidase [Arthrobacter agilis]
MRSSPSSSAQRIVALVLVPLSLAVGPTSPPAPAAAGPTQQSSQQSSEQLSSQQSSDQQSSWLAQEPSQPRSSERRGRSEPFVPEWSWPLTPTPSVLRRFQKPPQNWKSGHRGMDLAVTEAGDGFSSPADGVVFFSGRVVDRGVLSIDHGNGRISSFEPVETDLTKGRRVARGEHLGSISAAGPSPSSAHCIRTCLHWGVRVDGEYVDPLGFVSDRRPSVLLPLGEGRPAP